MGKPGMAMPGEHRSPSPFRDGTHTHNIRHGRSRNWNRAGGVRDNVPKIAMAFWHECRPFGTQVVVDRPPGTSVPVFPMPCLRHWCPVNVRDVTFGTDTWPRNVNIGRMAHKYPNILIHCVFSTKERSSLRKRFLGSANISQALARNHGIPVLAARGTSNPRIC